MAIPKRRPAKLRLLGGRHDGVDSGGRKVEDPPAFRRVAPEKPADLSPVASDLWDLIADELMRLELLKPLDAGALALACETFSRWKAAQLALNQELATRPAGEVFKDSRKLLTAITEASREYRAFCGEFGLTPSAEGRLSAKEAPGAHNPFAGSSSSA